MEEKLYFTFQGRAAEPYTVTFIKRSETNISAYCTCQAGKHGQYCKHRFGIIEGNPKGITSDNHEDAKTVQSWIPGTDIEKTLHKMRTLEDELALIKKKLSKAKKEMAQAMRD